MKIFYKYMQSPVGNLKLIASEKGLRAILWENDNPNRVKVTKLVKSNHHPVLVETEHQLSEYFHGKRKKFSLNLDAIGTSFQKKVWLALLTIPFGETRSYLDIAKQIGNVKAVRAVGGANARNPISIIMPCHRVIGSNGTLTGFAGGLDIKAALLKFEGHGLTL